MAVFFPRARLDTGAGVILPRLLAALAIAGICALPDAAQPGCPASAPRAWQAGRAPLVDARLLAYPASGPPVVLPFAFAERDGVVSQTWSLPTDARRRGFVCLYKNSDRPLPVPAPASGRCALTTSRNKPARFRCQ